jgi:hypothetical protein
LPDGCVRIDDAAHEPSRSNKALLARELAMRFSSAPIILGAALLCASATAAAQSFETLFPTQFLNQGAGCYSQRCFMSLHGFDGASALTSNTGPGIAVHVPGPGTLWTVQQSITNPDYPRPPTAFGPSPLQAFGYPTALDGDALVVNGTSSRYNDKDVVYVYRRTGSQWSHIQTLTLQKPADYDRTVVLALAISGDWLVVGGIRVDDDDQLASFSQFDLYKRNADGTFHRRGGFKPPVEPQQAWFSQVAISGNVIAIGDPYAAAERGRVYMYEYGAGGWVYRRTLSAPGSVAKGHFGESLALDGGTIAVTEPQRVDVRPEYLGVVHVYERAGDRWPRIQSLSGPIDPRISGYLFGSNIALSGRRLLVGKSTNEFSEHLPSFGYLYERRNQWLPVAELTAESSELNTAVALSGDVALVNATDFAYGRPVYVFDLPDLDALPALDASPALTSLTE